MACAGRHPLGSEFRRIKKEGVWGIDRRWRREKLMLKAGFKGYCACRRRCGIGSVWQLKCRGPERRGVELEI